MTRTVFRGAGVFDGTGSAPAEADVVVQDGRFVEVGTGLDGDDAVDVSGKHLLPGLFDCHIHVGSTYEDFDETAVMHRPFTYGFFKIPLIGWFFRDAKVIPIAPAKEDPETLDSGYDQIARELEDAVGAERADDHAGPGSRIDGDK